MSGWLNGSKPGQGPILAGHRGPVPSSPPSPAETLLARLVDVIKVSPDGSLTIQCGTTMLRIAPDQILIDSRWIEVKGSGRIRLESADLELRAARSVAITGNQAVTIGGAHTSIKGDATLGLSSPKVDIKSGSMLELAGGMTKITGGMMVVECTADLRSVQNLRAKVLQVEGQTTLLGVVTANGRQVQVM